MAEERQDYDVPPTRPSTPILRAPRIAEAPSRAEPNPPLMETSSPPHATTAVMAFDQRDGVNGDMTQDIEERSDPAPSSSNPALVVNGDSQPQSNPDVALSSCTDRSYIPTPYNSPIRRNPRQACIGSAMSTMRLRGRGPPKRPAPSLRGSNTKKTRVGKGRAKKSKDDVYDDSDSVLTDGNSPLYSDANITAILQHPVAKTTLAGTPIGDRLEALSLEALRSNATQFRNDGLNGYNDPDHLQQGLVAAQRRRNGDFDEYSRQKFTEQWGDDDDIASHSGQELARALDAYNGTGPVAPAVPDVDMANAPDENQNEKDDDQVIIGEYEVRPSRFHHRKDDDDNPPNGPAASFGASQTAGASMQASQPSDSRTTNGQQSSSNNSQPGQTASWAAYFADYVNVAAPPIGAMGLLSSDIHLYDLFTNHGVTTSMVGMRVGDILRVKGKHSEVIKEMTIVGLDNQSPILAIPPGRHVSSQPHLRPDLIFPAPNSNTRLNSHMAIYAFVSRLVRNTRVVFSNWKDLIAVRGGEVLGSVWDIRQATAWHMNECDFRSQLDFKPGRKRRFSRQQRALGYQFIGNASLYFKVPTGDLRFHNPDVMVDLGPVLNGLLSDCAESSEFTIVMVDNRVATKDGLFLPHAVSLDDALNIGPGSFPTRHCRQLAGSQGWSSGHAHIGGWGLLKGRSEAPEATRKPVVRQWKRGEYLKEARPGSPWTPSEIAEVEAFHFGHVKGHIRHYPVPINRSGRHMGGVQPQQFRRVAGSDPERWFLDPEFYGPVAVLSMPLAYGLSPRVTRNAQAIESERASRSSERQLQPLPSQHSTLTQRNLRVVQLRPKQVVQPRPRGAVPSPRNTTAFKTIPQGDTMVRGRVDSTGVYNDFGGFTRDANDAPRVTAYAGDWADHQDHLNSYHPPVPGDEARGPYLGASSQLSYFTRWDGYSQSASNPPSNPYTQPTTYPQPIAYPQLSTSTQSGASQQSSTSPQSNQAIDPQLLALSFPPPSLDTAKSIATNYSATSSATTSTDPSLVGDEASQSAPPVKNDDRVIDAILIDYETSTLHTLFKKGPRATDPSPVDDASQPRTPFMNGPRAADPTLVDASRRGPARPRGSKNNSTNSSSHQLAVTSPSSSSSFASGKSVTGSVPPLNFTNPDIQAQADSLRSKADTVLPTMGPSPTPSTNKHAAPSRGSSEGDMTHSSAASASETPLNSNGPFETHDDFMVFVYARFGFGECLAPQVERFGNQENAARYFLEKYGAHPALKHYHHLIGLPSTPALDLQNPNTEPASHPAKRARATRQSAQRQPSIDDDNAGSKKESTKATAPTRRRSGRH